MDYEKECKELGGDLEDALMVAKDFLEWYIAYLEREEPCAVNSIRSLQEGLDELPWEMKEE